MTHRWLSGLTASILLLGCAGEAAWSDTERLRQKASEAAANHQSATARKILREALAKESPALSRDQRAAAADLRRELAGIDISMDDLGDAERLYREALTLLLQPPAGSTEALINLRTQLAGICYRQGRLAEAAEFYREVLKLETATLGAEHPDVLNTLSILGGLELKLGRRAEAEILFRRQLVVAQRLPGAEKREAATVLDNLAEVLEQSGRLVEAAECRAQAKQIRHKLCDEC